MALFLNRKKLNFWIPKLIQEAKKEVVIIVPYIQISENIFNSLKIADKKGIQIILIYREDKLDGFEKEKLLKIKNISLMHHPNIHCKCYFNGDILVVGSINLYEYSEKYNREMGTLFSRCDEEFVEDKLEVCNFSDDDDIFIDAIDEIKEIVNGSSLEKVSEKIQSSSFEIDIIKTYEELEIERCNRINKYFLNKKFKPYEEEENVWYSRCENYFDNVDVTFESNRIAIKFNLNNQELKKLYLLWKDTYNEFEFHGFKYYWNYATSDLLIYEHKNFNWENKDIEVIYNKINEGIVSIINKYRKSLKTIRKNQKGIKGSKKSRGF